jgi:GT2 family glycosyltransferase
MSERVAIGMPIAPDRQANVTTICITESWTVNNDNVSVSVPSPSPEEGRDKIVELVNYMVPRPTHILFIDSDVVPRKNTLKAMLEHGKDIISAVVPICQQGKFKWNVSKFGQSQFVDATEPLGQNIFKAESVGFGCVLVKTSVLDKMEWPYWRSLYKPGLRTLGEDLYFCYEARKAGFDIWCDPKIKCDHVTRASYLSIIRNMKG